METAVMAYRTQTFRGLGTPAEGKSLHEVGHPMRGSKHIESGGSEMSQLNYFSSCQDQEIKYDAQLFNRNPGQHRLAGGCSKLLGPANGGLGVSNIPGYPGKCTLIPFR